MAFVVPCLDHLHLLTLKSAAAVSSLICSGASAVHQFKCRCTGLVLFFSIYSVVQKCIVAVFTTSLKRFIAPWFGCIGIEGKSLIRSLILIYQILLLLDQKWHRLGNSLTNFVINHKLAPTSVFYKMTKLRVWNNKIRKKILKSLFTVLVWR